MPGNQKSQHAPWSPVRPDPDISGLPLKEQLVHIARENNLRSSNRALEPDAIVSLVATYERTRQLPIGYSCEVMRAFGLVPEIRRKVDALLLPKHNHREVSPEEAMMRLLEQTPLDTSYFRRRRFYTFDGVSQLSTPERRAIAEVAQRMSVFPGGRELFEATFHLPHAAVDAWMGKFGKVGAVENGQGQT